MPKQHEGALLSEDVINKSCSLHHYLAAVVDVQSLLCRLARELATVEAIPRVSRIRVISAIRGRDNPRGIVFAKLQVERADCGVWI